MNSDVTIESLLKRVEELERRLAERPAVEVAGWKTVAGMFTGREFSKIVDEEGRKIREADRAATLTN